VTTDQGLHRPGAPDDGMVMDFAVIKQVMADVLEPYDHRFLVCVSDPEYVNMVSMPGRGVIAVPYIPTAENLAAAWGDEIADDLSNYGAELVEIRVWETPNACATWRPE
jgi:6-pyruvoyl-tetrahydropterin synthase